MFIISRYELNDMNINIDSLIDLYDMDCSEINFRTLITSHKFETKHYQMK